ncbi:subtilisin-like serine protease-like protein PR1A [Lepidopterella palustris CBS 459.81]|uniref:Subtilisin-like serine protease-like protein PR1A n=1 Tax=Lepidopterella palustris CBS 459.81 TaxID=1314670 RepID=A0A8E2JEW8_9PEZI|nr:subtilisin-like serine protease-like protein PR1A [Lepidopterella palustris CBS 459.81]
MRLILLLPVLPLAFAAPILTPRAGQVIPGKYIIKMKSDAAQELLDEALSFLECEADHVYGFGDFKGFAGQLSDSLVQLIAALPGVDYVEKDAIVKYASYVSEPGAPWGLGRISHVNKGNTTYIYDTTAGSGTCSYVLDTGIYTDHPEFEGRATFLANYVGDGNNTDGNGHGTHVAGTIGSKTYGVAKKTMLYAVKVLDASGSGTNSGIIAGILFAANDQKTRSCANGAVCNMSFGGGKSTAVNAATADAVSAGLFVAVAAGNMGVDAGNYSPASEPSACTVGGTDINDAMARYSNYGSAIDILAPGVDVISTWNNGGTATMSGTSTATPHISGLGAYLLAFEGVMTPAALCSRIQTLANKNMITGLHIGTVNYLAFNGNPSG